MCCSCCEPVEATPEQVIAQVQTNARQALEHKHMQLVQDSVYKALYGDRYARPTTQAVLADLCEQITGTRWEHIVWAARQRNTDIVANAHREAEEMEFQRRGMLP